MHSHQQDAYLCEECLTRIESYGNPCIKLLSEICHCNLEGELCIYEDIPTNNVKPPIKFLESKGFVVTTEIDERFVAVYVNKSRNVSIQDNRFCWCSAKTDL